MNILGLKNYFLLLIWSLSLSGLFAQANAAEIDAGELSSVQVIFQSDSSDTAEEDSEEDDEPDCD